MAKRKAEEKIIDVVFPRRRRWMRIGFAGFRMAGEVCLAMYHSSLRTFAPFVAIGWIALILILALTADPFLIVIQIAGTFLVAILAGLLFFAFRWNEVAESLEDRLKNQGEKFKSRWKYHRRLRKGLESLKEPDENNAPVGIIIRQFQFPFHFRFAKVDLDRFKRRDGIRAIRVATLFARLKAQTSKKGRTEEYFKDYATTYNEKKNFQKNALWDGGDVALRFRQSTSELPFYTGTKSIEQVQPKYVIFDCLMNPIRDPLYILPVSEVIAKLPESIRSVCGIKAGSEDEDERIAEVIGRMNTTLFDKFDNYDKDTLIREDTESPSPIARNISLDKPWEGELSWDINRVSIERDAAFTDRREVLRVVDKAIHLAAPNAIEVFLASGDMLVLDNRRALHCRKEFDFTYTRNSRTVPIFGVHRRWLRLYYGFERDAPRSVPGTVSTKESLAE